MEEKKFQACVNCLTQFNALMATLSFPIRKRSALEVELFTLLQFLTIEKERTIFEATNADIDEWLYPAIGFSDYYLRIELLKLISKFIPQISFESHQHPLTLKFFQLLDTVFWARKHRRLESRSRDFFQSITQQQIIESEIRCTPFYKALHTVNPGRDTSGAFNESDEEIVKLLRSMDIPKSPKITDLGCGEGRLLKRLRKEYSSAELYGTSIFKFSEHDLDELKKSGINPIYSSIHESGIADQSQDIVVSTEVIEHLRNPEEMVKEIHRILKPNGIFCVSAPSKAAQFYCKNPLSYLLVAFGTVFPFLLPRFHNLYSPLTPIRIVHYAFHPDEFERLFSIKFSNFEVITRRFISLRKFRLDRLAPNTPLLRKMGGLCIAIGRKD